jgi:hypothetical protein
MTARPCPVRGCDNHILPPLEICHDCKGKIEAQRKKENESAWRRFEACRARYLAEVNAPRLNVRRLLSAAVILLILAGVVAAVRLIGGAA